MLIALELFLLPLAKLLVSIPAVDSRMLLLPRSLWVRVNIFLDFEAKIIATYSISALAVPKSL